MLSEIVETSFEVIVEGVFECNCGGEGEDGVGLNCRCVVQLAEHWQDVSLQKSEFWKGCGDG